MENEKPHDEQNDVRMLGNNRKISNLGTFKR